MTDLPDYLPDKDELRRRLPLRLVCDELGIRLDEKDRALCPFHADMTPSFYLWEGDDNTSRYWCHPCGFGGDLFDLIMRFRDVRFPEAVELAAAMLARLPPGYEPPRRRHTTMPRIDEWAAEVDLARERAARSDHAGILSARCGLVPVEREELARRWDVYLRGTWGWGISETGAVLHPHWAPDGTLTGCKLRLGPGRKGSMPGSRYAHLYGSWLVRRHLDVMIVEGETDAAYAGWAAAEEGVPIDVLAMPSGASAPIDDSWLDILAGSRTVYLALDPDEAGVSATRRWLDALDGAGFRDVRVCCLPLGRDLRDARPRLPDLLARARRRLEEPADVATVPGGYLRPDRAGNPRQVTTWTLEPVAQLSGEDDPGFDVVLSSRGTKRRTVILLSDLASVTALNRWANKHGEIFVGTDVDRQRIATLLKARGVVTPEVFQTHCVGLHAPPESYSFAGPTVVLPDGYIGQLPWRYAPGLRSADVRGRVLLPAPGQAERWLIETFLRLSAPHVTQPLLAWLIAAARRPQVQDFPVLFIGGSSGVGKSTLARLACRLMGSAITVDLAASTPFILYRTLASSSSLPVFVDEWTLLSRSDTREALQGILPLLYSGGVAERGTSDLGAVGYRMSAPTIVAGEDSFHLDRELERTVSLCPTLAAQDHDALAALQGVEVERFGHGLHRWLSTAPILPQFPDAAPSRPEHNRLVLEAGWQTLRLYLDHLASLSERVPVLPPEPNLSCLEQEPDEEEENVYLVALAEAAALCDPGGFPMVWDDPEGRGTWVRFVALIGLLESRRMDLQLPGRSRAMRAYFRERYGYLVPGTVCPPLCPRPLRAHLIPGLRFGDEQREGDVPG